MCGGSNHDGNGVYSTCRLLKIQAASLSLIQLRSPICRAHVSSRRPELFSVAFLPFTFFGSVYTRSPSRGISAMTSRRHASLRNVADKGYYVSHDELWVVLLKRFSNACFHAPLCVQKFSFFLFVYLL